jgi:hypothetical protein
MLMKTQQVIYQEVPAPQGSPARQVTGQYLAKNRLNARGRARLAADIIGGEVTVRDLTVRQTARLCRVSEPYVAAVRRLSAAPESLAEHFARSTPAEWLEAARAVGIGAVWDRMIAPLV